MKFENISEHLDDIKYTANTVALILIDDKATKKIFNPMGNLKLG